MAVWAGSGCAVTGKRSWSTQITIVDGVGHSDSLLSATVQNVESELVMKHVIRWVGQAILACNLVTLAHTQTTQLTNDSQLDRLIESGLFRELGESMRRSPTTTEGWKIPFEKKTARSGDSAFGVEVAKTKNVVAIDTTPCGDFKTILRFREPYVETDCGLIRCASGYHHQVEVLKQ